MKDNNAGMLGKIILAAVLMIFGAVIIGVIADSSATSTVRTNVAAESHAMTAPVVGAVNTTAVYTLTNTGTYGGDCPISDFAIKNQSGGNLLTVDTDYTVNLNTGTYLLKNTTATVKYIGAYNNTYVDYKYCGVGYVNSTWGRSTMNMIGGFMALVLFGAAVGVMYSIYKDVTD